MRKISIINVSNLLGLAAMTMTLTGCGLSIFQSEDSALNEFRANGAGRQVDVAELKSKKIGAALAAPQSCKGFVNQAMKVGLWAGYTDDENRWGKARANCSPSGGGIYCKQDDSLLFEQSGGGTIMGMEIPRVFELGSTAQYLCMSAGRAVGLLPSTARSNTASHLSDQVSIEHVASLTASINSDKRELRGVYVISITSSNSKTNRRMLKKLYFSEDGAPLGARNSQEQNFNEVVQKQTGELHLLYPHTQSALNDPQL